MVQFGIECDFKAPAGFGDLLEIQVRVTGIGRTSFTMEYEIVDRKDRHLIASAKSVQVVYDYAAARPVPMPDEMRERIEDYEGRTLALRSEPSG